MGSADEKSAIHSERWSIMCGREIKNESGSVEDQTNFHIKDEKYFVVY